MVMNTDKDTPKHKLHPLFANRGLLLTFFTASK